MELPYIINKNMTTKRKSRKTLVASGISGLAVVFSGLIFNYVDLLREKHHTKL